MPRGARLVHPNELAAHRLRPRPGSVKRGSHAVTEQAGRPILPCAGSSGWSVSLVHQAVANLKLQLPPELQGLFEEAKV